jgi:hypothetical protein
MGKGARARIACTHIKYACTYTSQDGWAYASLVSLVSATSLCLVTVVAVLYREMKNNPAFAQWLGEHKLFASLLALLASTNTEVRVRT